MSVAEDLLYIVYVGATFKPVHRKAVPRRGCDVGAQLSGVGAPVRAFVNARGAI